jgi:hypothetical protein
VNPIPPVWVAKFRVISPYDDVRVDTCRAIMNTTYTMIRGGLTLGSYPLVTKLEIVPVENLKKIWTGSIQAIPRGKNMTQKRPTMASHPPVPPSGN